MAHTGSPLTSEPHDQPRHATREVYADVPFRVDVAVGLVLVAAWLATFPRW